MKLFKGLILTIVVVSIGFVGAKAQTWYPDDCSISAPDVVIPWNQSSTTGYINVTYWNYSQPYRGAMHSAYFNGTPLSWQGDYPTQFTFTVSAPSDYKAEVYFYSEIYTPTVRYRTCNVHVTKQHQVTVQNSFAGGLVNVGDTQTRPQYPSGTPFYWIGGTTHTLEAFNQDFQAPGEQNYFRVYGNWTKSSDINWSTSTNPYTMTASQTETYTANFKKQFNMALSAGSYDGASGGTYTVNGANVGATYNWTRLQDQSDSIAAVPPSNTFFLNWDDGNTSNPRTLTPTDHTTRHALYKAHLGTSASGLVDAKNQRRVSMAYGSDRAMVYESMGDIWITCSVDNGVTWGQEQRINTLVGQASCPSISNLDAYGCATVTWIENNQGTAELHLQNIRVMPGNAGQGVFFGWNAYSETQGPTNHTTLNVLPRSGGGTVGVRARTSARPVLLLTSDKSSLYIAVERSGSGIMYVDVVFSGGSGYQSAYVLKYGGSAALPVSTNTGDICPVIIYYPSTYGYPASTRIFYLAASYASGLRVTQYDYNSGSTSVLTGPSGEYTYYSLQGSASPGNASFVLCADAYVVSGYSSYRMACVFAKPTYYGSSAPSLGSTYTYAYQPTIMCENNSGFGSLTWEMDVRYSDGQT